MLNKSTAEVVARRLPFLGSHSFTVIELDKGENRRGEKMIDLRQGDCLELMKDIPDKSIDMILADLP